MRHLLVHMTQIVEIGRKPFIFLLSSLQRSCNRNLPIDKHIIRISEEQKIYHLQHLSIYPSMYLFIYQYLPISLLFISIYLDLPTQCDVSIVIYL